MFPETRRFREAVGLINKIHGDKFTLLLQRITSKLLKKGAKVFAEEEEKQLSAMLTLSTAELENVLEACTFVLEQAAFHGLSGAKLSQHLAAVSVDSEHCAGFELCWTKDAPDIVSSLRARPFGVPKVLKGTKWDLHLEMEDKGLARKRDPSCIFEFALGTPEVEAPKERFMAELSHDQLLNFFVKLERIQEQLDSLS